MSGCTCKSVTERMQKCSGMENVAFRFEKAEIITKRTTQTKVLSGNLLDINNKYFCVYVRGSKNRSSPAKTKNRNKLIETPALRGFFIVSFI